MSENERSETGLVLFCKVAVLVAFAYPLLHYGVLTGRGGDEAAAGGGELPPAGNDALPSAEPEKKEAAPQPSCPSSHRKILLRELCSELAAGHGRCAPEDVHNLEKHKLPGSRARNNTTAETRGTIVGCVAAGLLLTSLGAAVLELYKAKSQAPVKSAKPTLSRKCSLADLTVLKHNRKELVRRESIMEIPEPGGPLKPIGFKPPPLYRRCSFPVGPSERSYGNAYSTYQESRRPSIESRRLSIIESRKNSVSVESRKSSVDRRTSIDGESPERRHWSRLVHRH